MRTNIADKIKLFFELWKMLFKSKAEYRFNFFMEIFINIFVFLVIYLQIWVIAGNFGEIKGWSFYELMLLFNFNLFSYGFACIVLYYPMRELEGLVHSGEFDGVLVKPLNPFVYMLLKQSYIGFFGHIILATTVFVIAFHQLALPFNIGVLLDIIVKLIGAILIHGAIFIFTGSLCFKFVRSLAVMDVCIYRIRTFIKYPVSVYSTGIQIFLTVIVPYGFVNFYPVEALLGRQDNFVPLWIADIGSIVIGVFLIILSYKFFMRYVNKYQSTGS